MKSHSEHHKEARDILVAAVGLVAAALNSPYNITLIKYIKCYVLYKYYIVFNSIHLPSLQGRDLATLGVDQQCNLLILIVTLPDDGCMRQPKHVATNSVIKSFSLCRRNITLCKDVYKRRVCLYTGVVLYMTPCRLVDGFRRFVRTYMYCPKPQDGGRGCELSAIQRCDVGRKKSL